MHQEPQFLPSLMHGLYTTQSRPVTWDEVYRIITTDETVRQQTELYRSTHDEKYKHALPALTTAVQLDGKGKAMENIVGYTGMTHCDLDHVPEERLGEVLEKIKADPHTFLCNVSPSGRGVHIYAKFSVEYLDFYANCQKINRELIEKLNIPSEENNFMDNMRIIDGNLCSQIYDMAFMAMNCYYADLLGLPFDEQCSNPNKTLSLSHDPDAYYNPNTETFSLSTDSCSTLLRKRTSSSVADLKDFLSSENNLFHPLNPLTEKTNLLTERKHWTKVERDPIEFAEEYVHNRRGLTYTEGCRNAYLYECLNMMNLLGVPRSEAENWLRGFDLPEREKMSVLKSSYKRTADFGKFEQPYRWEETEAKAGMKPLQPCTSSNDQYTRTREDFPCPPLPDYQWPLRMQRMIDCGETKAQRDVILLSSIVVIGALMSKLLRLPYGHKSFWPNLQCFVIAPPASGKGCISWVRKLAEPRHKAMMSLWQQKMAIYRKEKAAYDIAGNRRAEMEMPVEPRMSMFLLAGNNSSTGIQENIMDAEGRALICEVEADTMSESINADYGGWSDLVRKAFEHERLAYNRRMNKEYREIDTLRLSVLLSGTPAQVRPLIPSAENGLYSRQIFYNMPAVEEWIDQFSDNDDVDYDRLFLEWGEEWKAIQDRMERDMSLITFKLDGTQRSTFNEAFAQLFAHAIGTHEDHHAKSSVIRLAINVLRMMSVVALLRALEDEDGLLQPAKDMPVENIKDGTCARFDLRISGADFTAVLSLAEPLYRHAMSVLQLLPSQEAERRESNPVQQLLEGLPMRFTRKEVLATAQQAGIKEGTVDSQLSRLVKSGMLHKKDTGLYEFASGSHARVKNS